MRKSRNYYAEDQQFLRNFRGNSQEEKYGNRYSAHNNLWIASINGNSHKHNPTIEDFGIMVDSYFKYKYKSYIHTYFYYTADTSAILNLLS